MALEQQAQASTSQSAMDVEMPIGDRWKQVDNVNSVQEIETAEDALESDEEWEEETTTTYVTFDFGMSGLTHDAFKEVSFMQLVGFNSSTPIVKIGAKIFRGQHERLIGTDVIYTEHDNASQGRGTLTPLAMSKHHVTLRPVNVVNVAQEAEHKMRIRGIDPTQPKRKPGRPKGSKNKAPRVPTGTGKKAMKKAKATEAVAAAAAASAGGGDSAGVGTSAQGAASLLEADEDDEVGDEHADTPVSGDEGPAPMDTS